MAYATLYVNIMWQVQQFTHYLQLYYNVSILL